MKKYIILLLIINTILCYDLINLNNKNTITLRGPIDEISSSYIIDKLLSLNYTLDKNNEIYLYMTTPGGSVISGYDIINIIDTIKLTRNISCITDFSASMGFAIFQTCTNRYILQHGILMQHQMSSIIDGPIEKMKSYMKLSNELEETLNNIQANRLKIDVYDFKRKIMNDWWTFGKNNIKDNIADKIVKVACDKEMYNTNTTQTFRIFNMEYKVIFSNCPLMKYPIEVPNNFENINIYSLDK